MDKALKIWLIAGLLAIAGYLAFDYYNSNKPVDNIVLSVGDTLMLDRSQFDPEEILKWESYDESIAEVDNNGEVTAKKKGKTTIVARGMTSESKYEIEVISEEEIIDVTSVKFKVDKIEIDVGKSKDVTYEIEPADATNKLVSWSSTDESVATVDNGKITGKKAGVAVISIRSVNNKVAVLTVNVNKVVQKEIAVEEIAVNRKDVYLYVGETTNVVATVKPKDATNRVVVWTSNDESIANVSKNGVIEGKKVGNTKVIAKAGGKKVEISVHVIKKEQETPKVIELTKFEFKNTTEELTVGDSLQLGIIYEPTNVILEKVTWTSSDEKIASVDSLGNVTPKKSGVVTITAKANKKTASVKITIFDKVIDVDSIEINKSNLNIEVGDSVNLKATIKPVDATISEIVWKSNNSKVAKVDSNGKVVGIGKGSAVISATAGNKSAIAIVEVKEKVIEVTGVSFAASSGSLKIGSSTQLTAVISPENATNKTVTWSSSNTNIATVSNGKVSAKALGTAKITATSNNGKSDTYTVTVTEIPVTKITLNKTSATLTVGNTLTLKGTISPSDATNKTITWSSSKTSVAKVDSNGKVTAVGQGEAVITAKTNNNKTATCTVTVEKATTNVEVTKVTLNPTSAKVAKGKTISITTEITPANATNKTITWSSSNTSVATVTDGIVKGVKAGSATITATASNGVKATCSITVEEVSSTVEVTGVSLNSTSGTLEVGKTVQLTATVSPTNATNKTITWSSSNTSVATVSNGLVTAKSAGSATITAKSNNGKSATYKLTVSIPVGDLNLSYDLANGIYDSCEESTTDFYVCSGSKKINITSSNATKIEYSILKKENGSYVTKSTKTVSGKTATVSLDGDGEYQVKAYPLNASGKKGSLVQREYQVFGKQYQLGVYKQSGIEIRVGVKGSTDFFEPNKNFTYYFKVIGKSLNGKKVTSTIVSKTSGLNISKTDSNWNSKALSISDDKEHLYTGTFNVSKNGVYTVKIKIDGVTTMSFEVGIVPKNQMANKSGFYYGVSPYISRAATWGTDYRIQDQTQNKSVYTLMETAYYMGVNVIREDFGWTSLQPSLSNSTLKTTLVDKMLNITSKYNFKYLWTLGNKRSDIEYYKSENLHYYKSFMTTLANKYANNSNIIWEIWNEPDLKEFFGLGGNDSSGNANYWNKYGTKSQYLSMLNTASTALRSVNPKAFITAGGLAMYSSTGVTEKYRAWHGEDIFGNYVSLLNNGTINTYALHNHKGWDVDNFMSTVNSFNTKASSANLTRSGVYVTESGVVEGSTQAYGLASKVLWYRARGYKLFMQFSMLDYNINNWDKAIFSRYLSPRDAAITYSTVIRMLGQASYEKCKSNSQDIFADIYYNSSTGESIVPVFSARNAGKTITVPSGATIYDMYGNTLSYTSTITATTSPKYIVKKGKLTVNSFTIK